MELSRNKFSLREFINLNYLFTQFMDEQKIQETLAQLEVTLNAIPNVMRDFNDQVGTQMQRSFQVVQSSLAQEAPEYLEALNSLLTLQVIFVNTLKKHSNDNSWLTSRLQALEQKVEKMKADHESSADQMRLLTDSLSRQQN